MASSIGSSPPISYKIHQKPEDRFDLSSSDSPIETFLSSDPALKILTTSPEIQRPRSLSLPNLASSYEKPQKFINEILYFPTLEDENLCTKEKIESFLLFLMHANNCFEAFREKKMKQFFDPAVSNKLCESHAIVLLSLRDLISDEDLFTATTLCEKNIGQIKKTQKTIAKKQFSSLQIAQKKNKLPQRKMTISTAKKTMKLSF